jgi:hypothetical protein
MQPYCILDGKMDKVCTLPEHLSGRTIAAFDRIGTIDSGLGALMLLA